MNIISKSYSWSGSLTPRKSTKYIVIHHMAGYGSADDIHRVHLNNGWAGIGYHYYIRKDGSIYTGRPENMTGAHVTGYNSASIGVCFEGNYETDIMPQSQKQAGQELISMLKLKYSNAEIKRHRDLMATACPGKNFPFNEIKNGISIADKEFVESGDIVSELNRRGIMTDKSLWMSKCVHDSNPYWLARKIANMTVNSKRLSNLETVNDIVWELNYRGILTDKSLWLKLLTEDKNLYWLAYKCVNMTINK